MSRERVALAWARSFARGGPRASAGAPHASRDLGRFRLRRDQQDAVERITAAFEQFGGALLADPPGAGKTVVALALARAYGPALVVAPSTLRGQWDRAARRARVTISFASMESLSRGRCAPEITASLVIVDEAHHARTPTTQRYVRLAALCARARTLLLSATPVVNRARDRDAMLALFLGAARRMSSAELARCIVRRGASIVRKPRIRRSAPIDVPPGSGDPAIAAAIDALPAPLPAADGRAALALIRVTLAFAWSSSLAALDAALRRRIQRGETIADALDGGDWPTRAALRQWTLGPDATQLVLPGLLGTARTPPSEAAAILRAHVRAVRALRAIVRAHLTHDSRARAHAILRFTGSLPSERVVVFARHAETVRMLWSELRSRPGVVAIIGERVLAAHGRWSREEVLASLGPRAKPWDATGGDIRAIRLLLTTDLLSEGVELQGIGGLVHADRAWTPATLEQREGRIARPGGGSAGRGASEVTVTAFRSPAAAEPLLRLGERLAHKQAQRSRSVAGARCVASADRAFARAPRASSPRHDRSEAFLAALRIPCGELTSELVVAGERRDGAWRLSASPCAIARMARRAEVPLPAEALAATTSTVRRALARWWRRRSASLLLGVTTPPGSSAHRASRTWARLDARIGRLLATTGHASRARYGAEAHAAVAALRANATAGLERALEQFLRAKVEDPGAFMRGLADLATSGKRHDAPNDKRGTGRGSRAALVALLHLAGREVSPASRPRPARPAPSRPPASP